MQIIEILKNAGVVAITAFSQMSGIQDSTKNGKPAIINAYSEHCGYSHQMASEYANYVPMNDSKIAFYGVDVNNVDGVTDRYEIRGVPVFIGFACGEQVGRVDGADKTGLSQLMTNLGDKKC